MGGTSSPLDHAFRYSWPDSNLVRSASPVGSSHSWDRVRMFFVVTAHSRVVAAQPFARSASEEEVSTVMATNEVRCPNALLEWYAGSRISSTSASSG